MIDMILIMSLYRLFQWIGYFSISNWGFCDPPDPYRIISDNCFLKFFLTKKNCTSLDFQSGQWLESTKNDKMKSKTFITHTTTCTSISAVHSHTWCCHLHPHTSTCAHMLKIPNKYGKNAISNERDKISIELNMAKSVMFNPPEKSFQKYLFRWNKKLLQTWRMNIKMLFNIRVILK